MSLVHFCELETFFSLMERSQSKKEGDVMMHTIYHFFMIQTCLQKRFIAFLPSCFIAFPLLLRFLSNKSSLVADQRSRHNIDLLSLLQGQEVLQCLGLHVVLAYPLHPVVQALPGSLVDPKKIQSKCY